MSLIQKIVRGTLAIVLLGSLSACVVAPPNTVGYRAPSVYVETYPTYSTYPTYRYNYPNTYYYGHEQRYYDNGRNQYYRDGYRYQEPRRVEVPLPPPAQMHRDIRRSLGLPRLPGMP